MTKIDKMTDIDRKGIEFLNSLYRDTLYKSDAVMHGIDDSLIKNKIHNIWQYISRMQELHERVLSSDRDNDLRLLKEFYYRKYLIKEEDIPNSYYEHCQQIDLETGKGYVVYGDEKKHKLALEIIENQKKSLGVWIDYFMSSEAQIIPMWAKYWAFQGMLSLGSFDKNKGLFRRRSQGTIDPFIDLNPEALALSIDVLLKTFRKEEINDKKLEKLVLSGSFNKIYSYILTNVLNKKKNSGKSNEGKWIKYEQGSDHILLVRSLQGYNTGWCTAGEETARGQLANGDFYVYYSYNDKGEPVIPRIAIRMQDGNIAEIRGVANDQNLEEGLEEILEEKLKYFHDRDKYKKRVKDMKLLTKIHKKVNNNQELTKEEIIFLYEIYEEIEDFHEIGERDPRIEEIREKRSFQKDISYAFGCTEEQIGYNMNDLENNCVIFLNDLIINGYSGLISEDYCFKYSFVKQRVPNPEWEIWNIFKEEGYTMQIPKIIKGNFSFTGNCCHGIEFPQIVTRNCNFSRISNLDGAKLPIYIGGGTLNLESLKSAKGASFPNDLKCLYLNSLTSTDGLVLPESLELLNLDGITSLNGLQLPDNIENLSLNSLTSTDGLVLPKSLKYLSLNSLTSANGLNLPDSIYHLSLNSLTSTDGLVLPESIYDKLELNSLTSVDGLSISNNTRYDLFLNGIKNGYGLTFPNYFYGEIHLESLTDATGLQLPNEATFIYMYSLENLDGVKLPENFAKIYLANGVIITPENRFKFENYTNMDSLLGNFSRH